LCALPFLLVDCGVLSFLVGPCMARFAHAVSTRSSEVSSACDWNLRSPKLLINGAPSESYSYKLNMLQNSGSQASRSSHRDNLVGSVQSSFPHLELALRLATSTARTMA
jgi:hypothetical protein